VATATPNTVDPGSVLMILEFGLLITERERREEGKRTNYKKLTLYINIIPRLLTKRKPPNKQYTCLVAFMLINGVFTMVL
jgi:hypothetical protein